MSDNIPFVLFDDSSDKPNTDTRSWRILVVDDDPDVHRATRFALKNVSIHGRDLHTVHAHSVAEALEKISDWSDIAVALVDVVMETDDAGLQLVGQMREAGLNETRIVLRTGYPGYAPELSVITDYDIDDYRTKDEMTRTRLLSVLTSSIRSYDHIHTLARSRKGLEMVIRGAREIFHLTNVQLFSDGILLQVSALLRIEPSGFVCAELHRHGLPGDNIIISACGHFAHTDGRRAAENPRVMQLISAAGNDLEPVFCDGFMVLSFHSEESGRLWVVLRTDQVPDKPNLDLLRLFATNIAIGFENITLMESLETLAHTDPIFGLPNLNACTRELEERLESPQPGYLGLITIGSFQSLFAQFGPENAVSLIREIYARLDNQSDDLHTSIMADGSFGLISSDRDVVGNAMKTALDTPVISGDLEVPLTHSSVMIELGSRHESAMTILRDASLALIHVRHTSPGGCEMYDEELISALRRRRYLTQALRRDVREGTGFRVFMQPKNRLSDGAIIGAEALLRWQHKGEDVGPAEFIPLAEMAGLIQLLTLFVIRRVADWLKHQPVGEMIPVSVNLSMADLNKPGLATSIIRIAGQLGINPAHMEFEVTEGVAMENAVLAASQVEQLAAAGFQISLDDFGTGYSSLGQFDRLPINTIKIDRAFVSQICESRASRNLASVIIGMTRALNVHCVAEGIETEDQRKMLMKLGCHTGQGFLFSKPVAIERFNDLRRPSYEDKPSKQSGSA